MTASNSPRARFLAGFLHRVQSLGAVLRSAASLRGRRRSRCPVILQMSGVECGAACLAMILGHHGRPVGTVECRERTGTGRDGTSALGLLRAGRSYGLRSRAYSCTPHELALVPVPFVAHWSFNHFVVVEQWSPGSVQIVDPSEGRKRLTGEEFGASFTGVVLAFEPGSHFERGSAPPRLKRLGHFTRLLAVPGLPAAFAQVLVASVLLQLVGLAGPVLTKVVVDHVAPGELNEVMPAIGAGIVLAVAAQWLMTYLRSSLLIYLQGRLDTHLMLGFFEHLISLPYRFFQSRTSGDLLMRLGSNAVIRNMLTGQAISSLLDGSLVLVYLAILMAVAPQFGIFVLFIAALQVLVLLATTRRTRSLMQRELAAQAESQGYLGEALKGVATLKASGADDQVLDHWSNLFFRYLNVNLERSHLSAMTGSVLAALHAFAPLALLWFGVRLVFQGDMTLGTMLALTALASAFLTPLASLVSEAMQMQVVGAHLDRIVDILETEPEQDLESVRPAHRLRGGLELRDVSFQYDPAAPPTIRNVSLRIEPGQKVAVVGRTGSGKTTLAMLALGLYEPSLGKVLYDGVELGSLSYRSVRMQVGVVLQDAAVFSGSIRQNISMNSGQVPLERIVAAARLAALHDDVEKMPMGYETLLAEGGTGLSGGQLQRLVLARALVQEPAILLMDEATSHLDTETERLIEENLNSLSCTRFVIAHRLSTVRTADVILVVADGTIAERGTHEELLARGGHYAALVSRQISEDGPQPRVPAGRFEEPRPSLAETLPRNSHPQVA